MLKEHQMEGLTLAEWTSLIEHGESRFESLLATRRGAHI